MNAWIKHLLKVRKENPKIKDVKQLAKLAKKTYKKQEETMKYKFERTERHRHHERKEGLVKEAIEHIPSLQKVPKSFHNLKRFERR